MNAILDFIDSNEYIDSIMATLTIRNLDDEVKRQIRLRGALNGRSMEAEARAILAKGVGAGEPLEPAPSQADQNGGPFDHLVGIWKGRMTTAELMTLTRGED